MPRTRTLYDALNELGHGWRGDRSQHGPGCGADDKPLGRTGVVFDGQHVVATQRCRHGTVWRTNLCPFDDVAGISGSSGFRRPPSWASPAEGLVVASRRRDLHPHTRHVALPEKDSDSAHGGSYSRKGVTGSARRRLLGWPGRRQRPWPRSEKSPKSASIHAFRAQPTFARWT